MKRVGQIFRETLVNRIKDEISGKDNVFLLSYSDLSGEKINALRKELKKTSTSMVVSKNAIAQLALKEMDYSPLAEKVEKQTAFIWGNADSSAVSKILIDFEKDCNQVKVQGGILEGKVLDAQDVVKLSDLPSREVLLSMLLSAIQSPLSRLAGVLNAKTRDLLSVLKQISEQKGEN